jgi:hypothetical protein
MMKVMANNIKAFPVRAKGCLIIFSDEEDSRLPSSSVVFVSFLGKMRA